MSAYQRSRFGDGGFRANVPDSKMVLTPGGGISGELKKMPRSRGKGGGGYLTSKFKNTMKVHAPHAPTLASDHASPKATREPLIPPITPISL